MGGLGVMEAVNRRNGIRSWLSVALLAWVLAWAASAGAGAGPAAGPDDLPPIEIRTAPTGRYVEGEVLVTIARASDFGILGGVGADVLTRPVEQLGLTVEQSIRAIGGTVRRTITLRQGSQVRVVELPPGMSVPQGIQHIRQQLEKANVAAALDRRIYVEPNYLWYPLEVPPNDPYFRYLWGLHNEGQAFMEPLGIPLTGRPDADIDAPEAWAQREDASDVIVAVIDTGVDISHPDLRDIIWVNEGEIPDNGIDDDGNGYVDDVHGWDFYHDDNTVFDDAVDDDHGTHVAGTIAAVANNSTGVAGIAWGAKIMPLKFLGPDGGATSDAIRAITYAAQHGATLSNNSWGGGGYSEALRLAIKEAGILFVAAAGNDALDNDIFPHYPSSYDLDNVIAVAASDWVDGLASFSNYGQQSVDLAAPGFWILSTVPGGYDWFAGTSMAAPHVAGAAALLIAAFPEMPQYPGAPGWSPGQETIKDRLLDSTEHRAAFVGKMQTEGRLNLYNALVGIYPPLIESFEADTVYGEGSLTVTFWWDIRPRRAGTTVSATIDFGDGTPPQSIGPSGAITHEYRSPGFYVASVHAGTAQGGDSYREIGILVNDTESVLLIDDDGHREFSDVIAEALEAAEIAYITVPSEYVEAGGLPPDVSNVLFWTAGITEQPSLTTAEIDFLTAYLENGGRLFLTGRGILNDIVGTSFARDFLGIGAVAVDQGTTSLIEGVPGDLVSAGLTFSGTFPAVDYYNPAGEAVGILTGDADSPLRFVAHRYAGDYRLVFAAFDVHRLPVQGTGTSDGLVTLVERIYAYLTQASVNRAPVVTHTVSNQINKKLPVTVTFEAEVSDPDGDEVAFEWRFWNVESGRPTTYEAVTSLTTTRTYTDGFDHLVSYVADDGHGNRVERFFYVITAPPSEGARDVVWMVDDPDEDSLFVLGPFNWAALDLTAVGFDVIYMDAAALPLVSSADGTAASGAEDFWWFWDGRIWGYPDDYEQRWIASLLDRGGKMWLSGEDLLGMIAGGDFTSTTPVPFMQQYFHVGYVEHDTGYGVRPNLLAGVPTDELGKHQSLYLLWDDLGAEGLDFTDTIRPTASGSGVFYDEGPVGDLDYSVVRQAGDYRRVFAAITPQLVLGYGALEAFFGEEPMSVSPSAPTVKPTPYPTRRLEASVMPSHPAVQRYQAQRPGPEMLQALQRVLVERVGALSSSSAEPPPVVLLGDYWHELRERVEYDTIPPRAAFSVSASQTVAGQPIAFTDESVDDDGTVRQWLWDFGDGTVSEEQNPTHAYAEPGQYVVSLTVVDDAGARSYPSYLTVTVKSRPVAVAGPDRYGAVNSPILLDGSASYDRDAGETVVAYEWSVVDKPSGAMTEIRTIGAPGEPAAKVHLLVDRPGEYRVRLVVTDSLGEKSEPDEVRVVVVQTYVAPNPARNGATFYYDAALAGGTLRIFNVAGRLVRTLALEADGSTTWDLTDASGRPLASGLYLWMLLDEDGRPVTARPERLVIQR